MGILMLNFRSPFEKLVILAGFLSIFLGSTVLIGWYSGNLILIQINESFVPMQYNTALGFLMSGAMLLLIVFKQNKWAAILGLGLVLIGGITLIEYIFGVDLFLDQIFMKHYVTVKTSHPGRMAPNTALSFLLTGFAAILLNMRFKKYKIFGTIGLFGALIFGLGLVASIGYLIEVETAYGWGKLTRMAIHTSTGFIVLGIGYILWAIHKWRKHLAGLMVTTKGDGENKFLLSENSSLYIIIVIVFFLSIMALTSLALSQIEDQTRRDTVASLQTVLETTNEAFHIWADEQKHDIAILSLSPTLINLTKSQLAVKREVDALLSSPTLAEIREFSKPTLETLGNIGIFIISPDFISIASMRDANVGTVNLIAEQRRDLLQNVFNGKIEIIPLLRSDVPLPDLSGKMVEGYPTMFIAGPIKDENEKIIAAFTMRIDPTRDFSRLARIGRIGMTGETYLFDNKGRLLSESRFDDHLINVGLLKPNEPNILTVSIRDPGGNMVEGFLPDISRDKQPFTYMAERAISGEAGFSLNEYRDYRGVPVLGAWLWDDELGFGMTTEIDLEDALGSFYTTRKISVGVLSLTILLTLTLSLIIVQMREQSREILSQSRERARNIINTALDAVVVMDDSGSIIDWNPQAEMIFGWSRNEAIGDHLSDLIIPPQYREAHGKGLQKFLTTGKDTILNKRIEMSALHRDGHEFPVELSISPLQIGDRHIFSGFVRDITRRKEAERELQLAHDELELRVKERTKQLEISNKDLEAFSYSVSHDLRAPLRAIDGFSKILVEDFEDKIDDEGNRLLNVIRTNTQNMGNLIDDLLTFSRLGRKELNKSDINMPDMVKSVYNELKESAQNRKINLRINSLPSIWGDPSLIRQIVSNLLSNAIKFTEPKQIANISVSGKRKKDEIIYSFKDNGVGFDMRYANKLFGVFQRLHSNEEFEGTGIGLSLVRRIISKHGGKVWAESELNEGSTFYISIPNTKDGVQ